MYTVMFHSVWQFSCTICLYPLHRPAVNKIYTGGVYVFPSQRNTGESLEASLFVLFAFRLEDDPPHTYTAAWIPSRVKEIRSTHHNF